MRILAVANQKGGVGKTTVSVHLADAWRRSGKRVLFVDLDQQTHATDWLLGPHSGTAGAVSALRTGRIGEGDLFPVDGRPGMHILPASSALADAELFLAGEPFGETLLRDALDGVAGAFDLVVLDCAPTVSIVTISALAAADAILIPATTGQMPLKGVAEVLHRMRLVRERMKVPVRLLGVLLFAADDRESLTSEARDILREHVGALLDTEVRVSAAAKTLAASRATAFDHGADARGREDYERVAAEVLSRLEGEATHAD